MQKGMQQRNPVKQARATHQANVIAPGFLSKIGGAVDLQNLH
jgi:hypothetical protein